MKVKVFKKHIRINTTFFSKEVIVFIPLKKEKFLNQGWWSIDNVDEHLEYLSKNFNNLIKHIPNTTFGTSNVLPGELLLVDKSTNLLCEVNYEINDVKYMTHFKISKDGIIITDITYVFEMEKKVEPVDLEQDALEKRQEELYDQLRQVKEEIDLYEEDYRPELEDQKEYLEKEIKKINKEIDRRNQL